MSQSFVEFMIKNNVVATTAGITIGFATATFVKSFVSDVIMPLLFLLIVGGSSKLSAKTSSFFGQFLHDKEFRFTNFVSELVTWIVIIVCAYLIIDLVVLKALNKTSMVQLVQQSNPFNVQQPTTTMAITLPPTSNTDVKEGYAAAQPAAWAKW